MASFSAIQQIGRRRVGEGALLVDRDHVVPVPVGPQRRIRLRSRQRLFRDRVEAEARRQHHALLRPGDGDIDAPGIVLVFQRGEAGDGVDHQQRRMVGAVQRLADFERMGDAAGRGLVVDDADGLDLCWRSAASLASIASTSAPRRQSVGRNSTSSLNFSAMPRHSTANWPVSAISTLSPGDSVLTIAASQAPVPDDGIDDDRLPGAENALAARQHGMAEFGEFGTAMIQGRHVHGPQHPVGHVGRSWNLEKMPSCMQGHLASFPGVPWFRGARISSIRPACPPTRRTPSLGYRQ